MDEPKGSNLSSASIVDLKAELARKQNEFKQQKIQNSTSDGFVKAKVTEKKLGIFSKKNTGVLQRAQRDIELKIEDDNEYEKSRNALKAKAALYEKITQGNDIPDEDGSQMYLVDFQKKVIDDIVEKREKQRKEEEEKELKYEKEFLEKATLPPPTDDEEWVDYTDSLGRSRRCMKRDLPELKKQDRQLTGKLESDSTTDDKDQRTLMSHDMRREMLRQKWEKEEQEALNRPVGPTHYANVQFDEIRTHGVGYYQFSKDEESRQEQMETLTGLRKQTMEERDRKERLKEKRKAMLDARLAKVKQRKMMREGGVMLSAEDIKDESKNEADNIEEIGPTIGEAVIKPNPETPETKNKEKAPELLVRDDKIKQNAPLREWDKGKEKLFAREDKYIANRREERIEEFAPPQMYYDTLNDTASSKKNMKNSYQPKKTLIDKNYDKNKSSVSNFLKMETATRRDDTENLQSQKRNQAETLIDTSQIPLPGTAYPSKDDRIPAHATPDMSTPQFTNGSVYNSSQIATGYQSGYFEPPIPERATTHGSFFPNTSIPPPPLIPGNTSVPPPPLIQGSAGFPPPPPQGNLGNMAPFSIPPNTQPQQIYTHFPEERIGVSGTPCHNPYNSANTNTNIHSDLAYGQTNNSLRDYSDVKPVLSSETVVPKPVKLNIVDPRFIRNQETIKSGTQNLSRADSNTNDTSSRLLSNSDDPGQGLQSHGDEQISSSQGSAQESDKDGSECYATHSAIETPLEGQIVFKSSPVVYHK